MSSEIPKGVSIFGATGSIGQSAADVIVSDPGRFSVRTVTAHSNAGKLAETAKRLNARHAVIGDEAKLGALKDALSGTAITASGGGKALIEAAQEETDLALVAIVGFAGLPVVMNALYSAGAVAIANKEPLVAAGRLVMAEAQKHKTKILPVDSEHNAIFQVYEPDNAAAIEKIILTASGGPFRTWSAEQMKTATTDQALAHPNWVMGEKISIDSATMMNKALEVIEAHYLFGIERERIEVLIHPQSVVHSMVEYADGSVLAQMGASDMRTPIANVLAWPGRMKTPGQRLDLKKMKELHFEAPDTGLFPALALAYDCLAAGEYACIALNAANEVAVDAFLNKKIIFTDIVNCAKSVLDAAASTPLNALEDIISYDGSSRRAAQEYINKMSR